MLPRPTRTASSVSELVITQPISAEALQDLYNSSACLQPLPGAPIGREDLPDFLFEDEPTPVEVAPVVVEERWSEPFAGGVALSDKVMSYGRKTPAPIDNLPHSSMRRGRRT